MGNEGGKTRQQPDRKTESCKPASNSPGKSANTHADGISRNNELPPWNKNDSTSNQRGQADRSNRINRPVNNEQKSKSAKGDNGKTQKNPTAKSREVLTDMGNKETLRTLYTNPDSLRNKMEELREIVNEEQPHLICVTETKPKVASFDVQECEIRVIGYNLYVNNLKTGDGTRGCAIYVRNDTEANKIEFENQTDDSVWVEIKLYGQDTLLVGVVYRSPGRDEEEVNKINRMIEDACHRKNTHILIVGDFNFPEINWSTWGTKRRSTECIEQQFINCLEENYLEQHVEEDTRGKVGQASNILDLIITNEKNMIENISTLSPLGKADHAVLIFNYKCYTRTTNNSETKFNLNKGDYDSLRKEVAKTDWDELANKSTGEMWLKIKEVILDAMGKYIPMSKVKQVHGKKMPKSPKHK
jgi:exonuclease III